MRSIFSATQSGCRRLLIGLALLMTPLAALAASADIALLDASAATSQADRTPWSLEKTGQRSGNTVNWTVTATPGAPEPGALVISGQMTVVNRGSDPATIGNIVVNLQVRSGGRWITLVSNIADATRGDAATTARVMPQASSEGRDQFTESGASGELEFMDATNNTAFSLVPQILIPAGGSHTLLFQASFDNGILALPTGAQIRAETIVSFGNATAKGNSVANLDINGNGTVDADEANVRSVPARIGLTVPVLQQGNDTVSLSDTLADIVTTGSVTFTNATFNLGATGGTVSVTYDAGADGGTITNCAYLTGTGVDLEACDTQTIPEPNTGCTPGAAGCWEDGDLVTWGQGDWRNYPPAATILTANYAAVYASLNNRFEVGILGAAGFSILFSNSANLLNYLPAAGTPAALNGDLLNPTTTASGAFGGDISALKLNVDYSDAGRMPATASLRFGDLTLCGLDPALNGQTVRQVLATANTLLGGGSAAISIANLSPVIRNLNGAFSSGNVTTFAQDHLVNGPCPPVGGWQPGGLTTYAPFDWDFHGRDVMIANHNSVYASTFGSVEIGIPGPTGFSLLFSGFGAILDYLPPGGPYAALNADLLNPTSSSSGAFGGEVLALKLNVDYADAGALPATSGLHFGDLTLCGLGAPGGLDGTSVRDFLGLVNTLLGGGANGFAIPELAPITSQLNSSFRSGLVSAFAQNHLVNGPCPPAGRWQPGDLTTYAPLGWDFRAPDLMIANHNSVYASTFGSVEIGIPGPTGFSLLFSGFGAILDYLPPGGPYAALNADLLNPTSSSSGAFGGEVLALKLNVDYADAGALPATSGLRFGNLTLCGLGTPGLDGTSVRDFLGLVNTLLGGGANGFAIPDLALITSQLNSSFGSGLVSFFARDHLVDGPCPL